MITSAFGCYLVVAGCCRTLHKVPHTPLWMPSFYGNGSQGLLPGGMWEGVIDWRYVEPCAPMLSQSALRGTLCKVSIAPVPLEDLTIACRRGMGM